MKKLFALVIFFMGIVSVYAQSIQNQQKLIDYLGQERFQKLTQANSPSLLFMDKRASHGYEIMTIEPEKLVDMNQVHEFVFSNSDKSTYSLTADEFLTNSANGSLNILQLNLKYDPSSSTFYRIGNSDKVLVLKSVEFISKK